MDCRCKLVQDSRLIVALLQSTIAFEVVAGSALVCASPRYHYREGKSYVGVPTELRSLAMGLAVLSINSIDVELHIPFLTYSACSMPFLICASSWMSALDMNALCNRGLK